MNKDIFTCKSYFKDLQSVSK